MVDRVQFLQKLEIEGQNYANMIMESFDQFMALYFIVGHYDDAEIHNDDNLTFTISFTNKEMIDKLISIIAQNNYHILIYGKNFSIAINWIKDLTINITIA